MPQTGVFRDLRQGYLQSDFLAKNFSELPESDLFFGLIKLFNYHPYERALYQLFPTLMPDDESTVAELCDTFLDAVILLCAVEDTIQGANPDRTLLFTHKTTAESELKNNFNQYLELAKRLDSSKEKSPKRLHAYLDVLIEHFYVLSFHSPHLEVQIVSDLQASVQTLLADYNPEHLKDLKKQAKSKAKALAHSEYACLRNHTRAETLALREISQQVYERLIRIGTTLFANALLKLNYSEIDSELIAKNALRGEPINLQRENAFVTDLYLWLAMLSSKRSDYFEKPKHFINFEYKTIVNLIKTHWSHSQEHHRGLLRLATAFSFDSDITKKNTCKHLLDQDVQVTYEVSEELFKYYFKFHFKGTPAHNLASQSTLFSNKEPSADDCTKLDSYEKLLGQLFESGNMAELDQTIAKLYKKRTPWRIGTEQPIKILEQCQSILKNN